MSTPDSSNNEANSIKIPNIVFQKYDSFDNNFKILKLIRDEFVVGKVFEIVDIKNSNTKYFSEFIEETIMYCAYKYVDVFKRFYDEKFGPNKYHGAVSNYTGICQHISKDCNSLVLISDYYPNGSLKDFINLPNKETVLPFSLNTHIQIILYGIASGMDFLCKKDCPRAVLFKSNIRFNEFLFPKISFYGMEKGIGITHEYYKNDDRILFKDKLDTAEGEDLEVFNYALILYELLMKKNPIQDLKLSKVYDFLKGERPPLDGDIPNCYKDLISKCWTRMKKYEKSKRPKFHTILSLLKKQEFILDGVDTDIYFQYIDLIKRYKKEVDKSQTKFTFEYYVSLKTDKFKKVLLFQSNKEEEEDNDNEDRNELNVDYLDISKFVIKNKIGEGLYGQVFVVEEKEKGDLYAAKISKNKIYKQEEKKTNIYREAQLISQLNHPCILKFIGYSPIDFDNNKKPVILTEYNSNGSLSNLLELERQKIEIDGFDETKKLMIIYGIVSCMSYLHSKGLIHRDLKPENFLLDKYLLPKLANFCYTKDTNKSISESGNEMIGMPKYFAPEIFEREFYSKSSDVYAFALILYEIVNGVKPFSGKGVYQIMTDVIKGDRPLLDESVPDCYRRLIESCWSQDHSKRPSFDQIREELATNEEFLNEDVEKELFHKYIKYINEYMAKYEDTQEIIRFEDHFQLEKVDLVRIRKEHFKYRKIISSHYIPNLSFYTKQSKIGEGSFGVIYKVTENSSNNVFAAKISKKQLYEMDCDEYTNLEREIEIISQLNNTCILKFNAFSPLNFEKEEYPVVVTEFLPKGSLKDTLNKEKKGWSDPKWDNTTKMINIYGIAFGMSYLHHLNIIHRDLKPDNVLLDDDLCPKIADFGLSKVLSSDKKEDLPSAYKFKGTPIYCSPEILFCSNYTKAGDVYAYAFIVYEIMEIKTPFDNENYFTLLNKIVKRERPQFDSTIPSCYRDLIERC